MHKRSVLFALPAVVVLVSCVTGTAVKQTYRGPATGGKLVEIGGKTNSMTGDIEITADSAVIARGRATPVVGSNSDLTGTYNGRPVKGQCVEVPVATRKLLGHTMTRCHVTIGADKPIMVEIWNDSPI